MKALKFIFNPFNRIAGMPALLLGLVFMAASLWLMQRFGVVSTGSFISLPIADILHRRFPLWIYMMPLGVSFLFPFFFFWGFGKFFSKSKIRLLDIAGTVAFSHVALLMSVVCNSVEAASNFYNKEGVQYPCGPWLFLLGIIFSLWFFVLLVNALKVSCNIRGLKLALLSIAFFVLSFFVTQKLSYLAIVTSDELFVKDENVRLADRNSYDLSIVENDTSVLLSGVWKGGAKQTPFQDIDAYMEFEFDEKWRIKSATLSVPSKNIKEKFTSVATHGKWNERKPIILKNEECAIDVWIKKSNEMGCSVLFSDSSFLMLNLHKIPYESADVDRVREIIQSGKQGAPLPDEQITVKGRIDELSAEYVAYRHDETGWDNVYMLETKTLAAAGRKIWRLRLNDKYNINSTWHMHHTPGHRGINYFAPHTVYLDVLTEDLVYEKTFEFPMDIGTGGGVYGFTALDEKTLAFIFNRTTDHVGGNESKTYLFDISTETLKELPLKMKKGDYDIPHLIAPANDGNFYVTECSYDRIHDKKEWVLKRGIFIRLIDRDGNVLKEYSELHEFEDWTSPTFKILALHSLKDGRVAFVVDESVQVKQKDYKMNYFGGLRVLDKEMQNAPEIQKIEGQFFRFTEMDGDGILLSALGHTDKPGFKPDALRNKITHVKLMEYDSGFTKQKRSSSFEYDGEASFGYYTYALSPELAFFFDGGDFTYRVADLDANVKMTYKVSETREYGTFTAYSAIRGNLADIISHDGKIYFGGTVGNGRFAWNYLMKMDFKEVLRKVDQKEKKGGL